MNKKAVILTQLIQQLKLLAIFIGFYVLFLIGATGIEKMTYEIVASQILFTAEQKEADLPEELAVTEETPIPESNKKKKDK